MIAVGGSLFPEHLLDEFDFIGELIDLAFDLTNTFTVLSSLCLF